MKLELVDDWRRAWRWVSINCMVLAGAVQGAWLVLDADQRAALPPYTATVVTIVVLAAGVAGRLIRQTPPACPPEQPK